MNLKCVTDGEVEVGLGLPQPGLPTACSPVSEGWHSYGQRTPCCPRKSCQGEGADWQLISTNWDEMLENMLIYKKSEVFHFTLVNRYISATHFSVLIKNTVGFSDIDGTPQHCLHLENHLTIKMIYFLLILNYWAPSPVVQIFNCVGIKRCLVLRSKKS